MIHIIEGNLLEAKENIIGHQVNCRGVMGSGVAKQIREKYPVVYERYKKRCESKSHYELLSDYQIVKVDIGKYVANLFGQFTYGRDKNYCYTSYGSLSRALWSLREEAESKNLSVALPYNIGCGLANGDWTIVYDLIDNAFHGYDVTLYVLG